MPNSGSLSGMGGASMALSNTPQKESETSKELNILSSETEGLHSVINMLADRLAPITQNVPAGVGEAEKRSSPSTAIASQIRIQSDKVNQASQAIRSILQRVEI